MLKFIKQDTGSQRLKAEQRGKRWGEIQLAMKSEEVIEAQI